MMELSSDTISILLLCLSWLCWMDSHLNCTRLLAQMTREVGSQRLPVMSGVKYMQQHVSRGELHSFCTTNNVSLHRHIWSAITTRRPELRYISSAQLPQNTASSSCGRFWLLMVILILRCSCVSWCGHRWALQLLHHKQAVLSLKRHFTGVSEVVCEDNTEAGIAERFSCQAASDPNFLFSHLGAFLVYPALCQ